MCNPKKYEVPLDITGTYNIEILAKNVDDAIRKAQKIAGEKHKEIIADAVVAVTVYEDGVEVAL